MLETLSEASHLAIVTKHVVRAILGTRSNIDFSQTQAALSALLSTVGHVLHPVDRYYRPTVLFLLLPQLPRRLWHAVTMDQRLEPGFLYNLLLGQCHSYIYRHGLRLGAADLAISKVYQENGQWVTTSIASNPNLQHTSDPKTDSEYD